MSFASGGFDSCVIKDESDNEGCWKLHLISSGSLFWCGKIWIFTSRRFCYYDLMSLLSSICGVSFCWGPARVNFDSYVFWNSIFTTEKNLVNNLYYWVTKPKRAFQILIFINFYEPLKIEFNIQRPSSSELPL